MKIKSMFYLFLYIFILNKHFSFFMYFFIFKKQEKLKENVFVCVLGQLILTTLQSFFFYLFLYIYIFVKKDKSIFINCFHSFLFVFAVEIYEKK